MVVIIMPKWFAKVEEDIKRLVHKIANEQNIKFGFVEDSKTIEAAISTIAHRLIFIKDYSHGEFTEEDLKEFKRIKKGMKNKKK